jgi:uncharacterized protein (TIGR02246 family)
MPKSSHERAWFLLFLIATLILLLALAACQQAPPPAPPDARAADEAAIRAMNDDYQKCFPAADAAKCASFYTEDAVGIVPGAPLIQGRAGMQQWYADAFQKKVEEKWTIAKLEVARSGDLAYQWGTGMIEMQDKKGKPTETQFKHMGVLKKQADGSWKFVVATLIPDSPAKPAAERTK